MDLSTDSVIAFIGILVAIGLMMLIFVGAYNYYKKRNV